MKIRKIYLLIVALITLVSACELPDNINPKAAAEVPAKTLLTNAEVNFVDAIDEISMNVNITRFLAQYCSQTAYTQESRYNFADRQVPDSYWNQMYRTVLIDLKEARAVIAEDVSSAATDGTNQNKLAIIDILEVYTYHTMIDFFGNVPYEEALMGRDDLTPAYDDAKTVYLDLMSRLTADIATLKKPDSGGSWGSEDLFYSGDKASWARVAASLKLRMAMRLADTDATAAQTNAEAAITEGLISSEEEGMLLFWDGTSPHVNTIHERFNLDGRTDYAPSKTIIDIMGGLNDPRMASYFTKVDTSKAGDFVYWGLAYGLPGSVNANSYSKFAAEMFEADYPAVLIGYEEVEFLLAEAAQRGFTTPNTAQEHYEAAVAASCAYWGVDPADASAYIAADAAWDAARWKEVLGTQKWIALYNRGNEGYANWRIFDWPVLVPPPDMEQTDIPLRWPYPFNEVDLNPDNYASASTAIGGDDVRTRVFWDATDNSATPSVN